MLLKAKSTIPIFGICRIYDISAVFLFSTIAIYYKKSYLVKNIFRIQNTEIYGRLPRRCAPRNDLF